VLWPDGTQERVETSTQLERLLRERLDWLAALALAAGFAPDAVSAAVAKSRQALDQFEAAGVCTEACRGPFPDVRCAANVEPEGRLGWHGFANGWNEPDGPPADAREHPVHYEYGGEFQRAWQRAVEAGIQARRRSNQDG
jgi:hypothetical protein